MAEKPLGRFCWFDLMVPEPLDALDFYKGVAAWSTEPYEGGGEPYTMWLNGQTPIGGVMELPQEALDQGAPPSWLAYISTPDIAETKSKATDAGGVILNELEIPDIGKIVIIADPQGAVFAAFESAEVTPGHDGPPVVGEFSWHELMTTDWEAAWDFYSGVFGWEKTDQMDMGEMGIYQMYGRGAHPLGGMMNRPPDMPASAWLHYIRVPDVDEAVARVTKLGGKVVNGPMEVPGGDKVAQCVDAQGAAFAVHATA